MVVVEGEEGAGGGGVTVRAVRRCSPPTAPVSMRLCVSYPWKATIMEKVCSKKKARDNSPAQKSLIFATIKVYCCFSVHD